MAAEGSAVAAPAAIPSRFDWSVGSAIGTSIVTVVRNFLPFVGLSLLIGVPRAFLDRAGLQMGLTLLADMVIGQMVTIILIYATVQSLRGRKAGIVECLGQGFRRLPIAIVVAIVAVLLYALGLILLIIPGLFLITLWAVAIPAAVVETPGILGSFSRSVHLTGGRRWRVFGTIFLSWLIYAAVYFGALIAIVPLLGSGQGDRWLMMLIPLWLVGSILQAYLSALSGVLYYFLRRDKEGADIETIAAVFD